MKLLSIEIKDQYKNLTGKYDFDQQDGYIALIGENGSGKSNLLEAISLIFNGIFNRKKIPFNYEIIYKIGDNVYKRGKYIAVKDDETIESGDMIYPSSIIACYSGEDRRLWDLAYKDYHSHYFNKAIKDEYYIPKLLYIDKSCWEIALITLIYAYDIPVVKEFFNSLGIDDISEVSISFEIYKERLEISKQHDALRWFKNVITRYGSTDINAKILATTDINSKSALAQKESKSKLVFQYLYLLSQPEYIEGEPNKVQKLIKSTDIKLNNISFCDLSEGEKKLILIECITKVLGDKDSLLLLDEPDAHTHIARKKKLLNAIENFDGQTILTTHSPVFANLLKDNNIFYINHGTLLDKEKSNIISSISNNSIDVISGACIISSKIIAVVEGHGDIKYLKKAIEVLGKYNDEYNKLDMIGFIPQGSASHSESFYEDVISKLPASVEKIIYLFDNDQAGKNGAKKIQGKDKVSVIYYRPDYTKEEYNGDYFIEDYFPTKYYYNKNCSYDENDFKFNHGVKYNQLKHIQKKYNLNTIKDNIEKSFDKKSKSKTYTKEDFEQFKPLLDKLLKEINE